MRARRRYRIFILAVVTGVAAAVWAGLTLGYAYRGFSGGEVFVDIAKGTDTWSMGRQLERAGVLRYSWQLPLARALRPHALLQAGEYRFAEAATPLRIIDRLARGDVFFYELRVPEGSNMFDIAALVQQLGVIGAEAFLAKAEEPSPIEDLDRHAPSLEGYLFPSTYHLTRHATAAQLCRMMTTAFRRQWKALAPGRADPHTTVTLASLVEKETASPKERPLIASVFRNRLARGMTLDCDPTTIYAARLEKRYRGAIHRSDLASENAYNTYRHAGLPPGPIANPGAASLKAALEPADTAYLYFVAKPGGDGHQFSRTIEEHHRRVLEYRRGLQAQPASRPGKGVSGARASR